LEIYKALVSLFNSEETSFWTRNNILVAVHGGLLAATAAIVSNAEKALAPGAPPIAAPLLFLALLALSIVGFTMAIAWRYMVARGVKIAETIEKQLRAIERDFESRIAVQLAPIFHAFVNFGRDLEPKAKNQLVPGERLKNIRLSTIWGRVGSCLIYLWAILALSFLLLLVRGHAAPIPSQSSMVDTKLVVESLARTASATEAAAAAAKASSQFAQSAASSAEAAARSARGMRRGRAAPATCPAPGNRIQEGSCICCPTAPPPR